MVNKGEGDHSNVVKHSSPSITFKRVRRSSRACECCHARKVRCDASTLGIPCTNCRAFGVDCRVRELKGLKRQGRKQAVSDSIGDAIIEDDDNEDEEDEADRISLTDTVGVAPSMSPASAEVSSLGNFKQGEALGNEHGDELYRPSKPSPRIMLDTTYLGESFMSTSSDILGQDQPGPSTSHNTTLPFPDLPQHDTLGPLELHILKLRGAFRLPAREIRDNLVESYFTWIYPYLPVVNKYDFMRQYNDANDPPPLLLLQAVLLAGSRTSSHPAIQDKQGTTKTMCRQIYKRAKALFDSDYEKDKVVMVQSLILFSAWWDGPQDIQSSWYWISTATRIAQGIGMHRNLSTSRLPQSTKRLYRRIWWTCFTRDRMSAVGLGRPLGISAEDVDVAMISDDDYIEDDSETAEACVTYNRTFVKFFVSHTKLCKIMGVVLVSMYSPARSKNVGSTVNLTHSDMELANWMFHMPEEMRYNRHAATPVDVIDPLRDYWSAILHIEYYTVLCLLHRPYTWKDMTPITAGTAMYQSRNIGLTASNMTIRIFEDLMENGTMTKCPSFLIYAVFSAVFQQIIELRSPDPQSRNEATVRLTVCTNALHELERVWNAAQAVINILNIIRANPRFQRRIQKAADTAEEAARAAWSESARIATTPRLDEFSGQYRMPNSVNFDTSNTTSRPSSVPPDIPSRSSSTPHYRSNNQFAIQSLVASQSQQTQQQQQSIKQEPIPFNQFHAAAASGGPMLMGAEDSMKYATNLFPENTSLATAVANAALSNSSIESPEGRSHSAQSTTSPSQSIQQQTSKDGPQYHNPWSRRASKDSSGLGFAAPSPFGGEAAAIFDETWAMDDAQAIRNAVEAPELFMGNNESFGMPSTINPNDWYTYFNVMHKQQPGVLS